MIGPGLDFTNKAEGYDFYPLQTIQPFALADSLVRTGLATAADLRMTTFDLSPRVNQHLETARDRALQGTPYDLQLPLDADDSTHHWTPELVSYWQHFGERIGSSIQALAPPAPGLRVRAIRIPPDVMKYVAPRDLNIVVQRLAGSEPPAFDLVVATNILVYYDAFEQGLALANVASLLRPGGYFVTNYVVYPTPPMEARPTVTVPVFFDRQRNGDTLLCYARR